MEGGENSTVRKSSLEGNVYNIHNIHKYTLIFYKIVGRVYMVNTIMLKIDTTFCYLVFYTFRTVRGLSCWICPAGFCPLAFCP